MPNWHLKYISNTVILLKRLRLIYNKRDLKLFEELLIINDEKIHKIFFHRSKLSQVQTPV